MVNYGERVTTGTSTSPESSAPLVARRLDAVSRRDQLVAAGLELIKRIPFDQLTADDVARAVGVSKGLVFHYFPTTRDLHVAVGRAATEELVSLLDVDPAAAPADRLRLGIDAFIAYIEQAPDSYVAMSRGAGSDPQLSSVFEETRTTVVGMIQSVLAVPELPPGLSIALRGWIAFVEEATLHWVANGRPIHRDELVDFLQDTAITMLPAALALGASDGGREDGAL